MKVITIKTIANVIRARRGYKDYLYKFISECKIVDAIPISEKATNGDIVKAMFPNKCPHIGFNEKYGKVWIIENGEEVANFKLEWWNAPYKDYTK